MDADNETYETKNFKFFLYLKKQISNSKNLKANGAIVSLTVLLGVFLSSKIITA